MTWAPSQYTKFEDERSRPVADLLARVPTATVMRAADLGCGPGNSTELLQARFPDATIVGIDSSPAMISAARQRLPGIRFAVADLATWRGDASYDVILSNAALQWVPDHKHLLPALAGLLAPGGSLAVQIPDNLEEPAHQLMRAVAADGPWATALAEAATARTPRHDSGWYFRLLRNVAKEVDVWRTTYHHPLSGGAVAVVEWFKGTGLRPFLEPLDEAMREAFLASYQDAIARAYPALPDGTVLLPFPRLFFVAVR